MEFSGDLLGASRREAPTMGRWFDFWFMVVMARQSVVRAG